MEYFVAKDASLFRVIKNEANVPLSTYVGILGMAGSYLRFLTESRLGLNYFVQARLRHLPGKSTLMPRPARQSLCPQHQGLSERT